MSIDNRNSAIGMCFDTIHVCVAHGEGSCPARPLRASNAVVPSCNNSPVQAMAAGIDLGSLEEENTCMISLMSWLQKVKHQRQLPVDLQAPKEVM